METKIRQKILLIFTIIICIFSITKMFALNITTIGLDSSLLSSYLAEDESKDPEIIEACDKILSQIITDDMTDFEKEIAIIRYLVANTVYDENGMSDDEEVSPDGMNSVYYAYGALIKHRAVCSGYAKAFDLLAKKAGITSIVVTGEATNSQGQTDAHAWNQVKLDDEWYNVDVTWEDPITDENYGYDMLRNEFINRNDDFMDLTHERETGNYCYATKYGKETVAVFLETGEIAPDITLDVLRKNLMKQIKENESIGNKDKVHLLLKKMMNLPAFFDNKENYFPIIDDNTINNYVKNKLLNNEEVIVLVTTSPNKPNIGSDEWLREVVPNGKSRAQMAMYSGDDGVYNTFVLVFDME